ncbi:hypothetical protein SSP35_28_00020 [Streptomyces sp. NBRC 110611]|nr:hypothetical protein SSP35_28_00020 [Streptomyces sp. NBRC 110611]
MKVRVPDSAAHDGTASGDAVTWLVTDWTVPRRTVREVLDYGMEDKRTVARLRLHAAVLVPRARARLASGGPQDMVLALEHVETSLRSGGSDLRGLAAAMRDLIDYLDVQPAPPPRIDAPTLASPDVVPTALLPAS